jgi:lysophospholipase L1-like esterase
MQQTQLLHQYDLVTLLIGVNNQYRGRSVKEFETEFENLLKRAIALAGEKPEKVFVISIPDWGVTPFAADRNVADIAQAIDAYNAVCSAKANELQCCFIDITTAQRKDGANASFLAPDQLHPSGLEYAKWAEQVSAAMLAIL